MFGYFNTLIILESLSNNIKILYYEKFILGNYYSIIASLGSWIFCVWCDVWRCNTHTCTTCISYGYSTCSIR